PRDVVADEAVEALPPRRALDERQEPRAFLVRHRGEGIVRIDPLEIGAQPRQGRASAEPLELGVERLLADGPAHDGRLLPMERLRAPAAPPTRSFLRWARNDPSWRSGRCPRSTSAPARAPPRPRASGPPPGAWGSGTSCAGSPSRRRGRREEGPAC